MPESERAHSFLNATDLNLPKMKRVEYDERKRELQIELLKMQTWAKETNQKIVVIVEGRDAAGKGGTIKRFMEHLNPRTARVVALKKPSEKERGQWYFQRYVYHMPANGEIVFFDRSWYNRAGVEKVMGFCSDEEYWEFMRSVPQFEKMLAKSGITLVKFWFSVSREMQKERFNRRKSDPLKQWKLSPIDRAAQDKWEDYTEAKDLMFLRTNTKDAPWTVIKSDDKKRARIECMKDLLNRFDYPTKSRNHIGEIDRRVVGAVADFWPELNHKVSNKELKQQVQDETDENQ